MPWSVPHTASSRTHRDRPATRCSGVYKAPEQDKPRGAARGPPPAGGVSTIYNIDEDAASGSSGRG
jgi:hypothetical protein